MDIHIGISIFVEISMEIVGNSQVPIYSCKYSKKIYNQHQLLVLILVKEYINKDYKNVIGLIDIMDITPSIT